MCSFVASWLTHLVKHVALSARKAAPVSEDDQWQTLVVDVLDGLSSLVCAVRVPDTTGLQKIGVRRCLFPHEGMGMFMTIGL